MYGIFDTFDKKPTVKSTVGSVAKAFMGRTGELLSRPPVIENLGTSGKPCVLTMHRCAVYMVTVDSKQDRRSPVGGIKEGATPTLRRGLVLSYTSECGPQSSRIRDTYPARTSEWSAVSSVLLAGMALP